MASERTHDETSPLLGDINSTVSTGAIPHRDEEQPRDSTQSADNQTKQPFPDAQKQLKYIVPAISIGVCMLNSSRRFTESSAPSRSRNIRG